MRMRKKYIHIYQCKSGNMLAEDIYDDNEVLILSKYEVINRQVIKTLNSLGIRQLSVYEVESSADEFKNDYRQDMDVMKQLLKDLKETGRLDYEMIESLTNAIYLKVNNISNIVECMNEVNSIDVYIYTHSINVAIYALLLAKWLCLSQEDIRNVVTTGILHDIGKIRLSEDILNKRGPLLTEEYEQVKGHVEIGYQLSETIPELTDAIKKGILMHHEREDGKGYPMGIKGEQISKYAKIIAVADVYDALTSERAYKKRITPFDTFHELMKIGYGYFDTKILMTFLANISCYYVGASVKMNNGETGKVIFVAPQNISMPIVAMGESYVDLSQDKKLKIVEMM